MAAHVVALPDFGDPAGAFCALVAGEDDVFWLDAGADAVEGWSFLGVGERVDPATLAGREVGRFADAPASTRAQQWQAGPFRGGWVGWVGYETGAARAGAPTAEPDDGVPGDGVPDVLWLRAQRWIALDHQTRQAWAVADADPAAAAEWADVAAVLLRTPPMVPAARDGSSVVAVVRNTPDEYAQLVEQCRDAIRAGDAYQLCLTTRFSIPGAADPAAVYLRLRATSRTGRGAFVRTGDAAVCSATPEQFLRIEADVVRTRPIKGTRPRGADPESDAALAAEMLASAKERAENVMIVDLMRNDLSRVCEVGSVRVDALLAVESYPHVHQLVSTVSGHLRRGVDLDELLLRTFPAGSMTGAPKLSAMTILHRLERGPRGVYAGCVGWIGDDGELDLAMVIRTVVVARDGAYVGAGGGITWSSQAWDEVHEVGVKARAPLAALGATLPPGW